MKVQLSLSAIDLPNLNSSADVKFLGGDDLGATEVAEDTSSPTWSKTFVFDYSDDGYVALNINVYDDDKQKIGSGIFDVAEFSCQKGNVQTKTLEKGGLLISHLTEYVENGSFKFQVEGKKFEDQEKWFFNKSDPYLVIKTVEGDEIYRSETLRDSLNPKWDEGEVGLSFCDGDLDKTFFVAVYDKNSKDEDAEMGGFETTVSGMISSAEDVGKDYYLTLNGKVTGAIYITKAELSGYQSSSAEAGRNMSTVGAAELCKVEFERKDEAAKAAAQAVIEAEEAAREAEAAAQTARIAANDATNAAAAAKEVANNAMKAIEEM